MSTRDLFDLQAGVDSEEDDEDFDEEAGEPNKTKTNGVNGEIEDSSEEEDEDEDEEAAQKIREGFIVDEDEEEDPAERRRRRKERKKRRREEREEEGLDDEDLDLIGALPDRRPDEPTFKRLKRGHREERERERGVDDIFSDEDEELRPGPATSRNALAGEFDDFIEEDEPDEGEGGEEDHEVMVGRTRRGLDALKGLETGLDEAAIEDMRAAFGDGTEYDWALDLQEDMDIGDVDPDKPIELKDVFEPSQLRDKMLTEEDQLIRSTDIPERMQIARKEFPQEDLDDQQWRERITSESEWVTNMLWPKKNLSRSLHGPFTKAVSQVLEFMNIGQKEVPYIFQHRKDYLIHAGQPDYDDEDANQQPPAPEKLLNQTDLWDVFELDLKYRSFLLKKSALERLYENVKSITSKEDSIMDSLLPSASLAEDVQDLSDYLHFQYAAEIKDLNVRDAVNGQKRSRGVASIFERIRAARAYNVVAGFGITADNYATVVLNEAQRAYPEDPDKKPMDMANTFVDAQSFPSGAQVFRAAKATFAEELAMSPKMRKLLRREYYMTGHFDCYRTAKGLKQIDEDNPNYEFKYLRNQSMSAMARRPELFLRMLKAEAEGLVELRLTLGQKESLRRRLQSSLESDNFSEIADAWNVERRGVVDMALARLDKIIVRGVKDNLKTECENAIAARCRERYSEKLDQAPYQPRGMDSGVIPRVLTMHLDPTNLRAGLVYYIWMEEDGRVLESKTLTMSELRLGSEEKGLPDGTDVSTFVDVLEKYRPDVVGMSGFSPETRQLYKQIQEIIAKFDIKSTSSVDEDDDRRGGDDKRDLLEVEIINDEVARLYHTSERAQNEFASLSPAARYCVALARYLQSPIKEYAALGRDIQSITFDPNQGFVPTDKLMRYLESAMIDMVNLIGVEINDALTETYTANLLPYICGLGHRKATYMLQVINKQGGTVNTRLELIGNEEENKAAAVTPTVFENCSSFLYIRYDSTDDNGLNYLDNTRAHPDDYDLANKMAADALDLDEEDVKAEKDEHGEYAVLRKMVKDGRESEVNSLVLERYAEQIEDKMGQRKRATLETIRAELSDPYEELRHEYMPPSVDEIFTMLTGETRESLCEGMIVPITIRKAFPDHVEVKLDCGIEGGIPEAEYPSGVGASSGTDPRVAFKPHQTIQGKVTYLNRKQLTAQLSVKEDTLRRSFKKDIDRAPGEWDFGQEEEDKREAMKQKESVSGRPQRVIKHPLFKSFNSAQAEEFLGPQNRGDVVIRPSSKGMDHLAVTWKVSDNVFQHIDVLELDKENEFSVGKTLKIGKHTYSDLDELIAVHVKSMAKKVDEITADERFQRGSKTQAEQWLTAYMEANPRRSMYAFCINPQYPGYFFLCFKPSQKASHMAWPIKIIPSAFELQKNHYPDMWSLKNGFKTLFMKQSQQRF